MTKKNDTDRYVVPNKERGGLGRGERGSQRASAHKPRKQEAVDRAREIVKGQGGGEIRIADKKGRFNDSDTAKGPRHKESKAKDRK